MRILVLTNNDVGLYRFRKELIEKLVLDHEVVLSLPDGEFTGCFQSIGCQYVQTEFDRRGSNPLADLSLLITYVKMIRKHRPDLVLCYTVKPNIYGGLACRLTRTPYLANITGLGTVLEDNSALSRLLRFLYRAGLKKAACVFFQNQENHKYIVDHRMFTGRTRLLPGSGVNLSEFVVADYPSSEEEIRFLFVGRVMKNKGIDELLKAIRTVKAHYPTATLDIVGGFDENYEKKLAEAQTQGHLAYHGLQNNVRDYIERCHCLVNPSYHEGMSNVLLEAAASGRPVIASKVPGCQETFDESISGLGCEVRSADSLAERMIEFIRLPHQRKKEMGLAGRRKMEREFSREIVINAYMEEIDRIAERDKAQ